MSHSNASVSTIFRVKTDFKVSKDRGRRNAPSPVNVIIWAMEVLGKRTRGVPKQRIKSLIKDHFILPGRPNDADKKIDMAVMFAVYFGILERCNNKYYLRKSQPSYNHTD